MAPVSDSHPGSSVNRGGERKKMKCGEKTWCELVQIIDGVCRSLHVIYPHRSAAVHHPGSLSTAVKTRGVKHSRRFFGFTAYRKMERIKKSE